MLIIIRAMRERAMKDIKIIDKKQYPNPLPWENKSFSMPNIPRGEMGILECLRYILTLVKNGESPAHRLNIKGSTSKIDLNEACVRLRPMGLVLKTQTGYTLSKEASIWLESGDDLYLAALLCARMKFLGEILYYLDVPRTAAQLQEIAQNDYALTWKTKSDINSRLVWLRQFELVEFEDFSLLYRRTEKGGRFVKDIYIEEAVKADVSFDETESEEGLEVSEWALEYCKKVSENRKPSIGYIVGNLKQFDVTLLDFVQLLDGGCEIDRITQYVTANYDISVSSLRTFFTTLTHMNFIQRKTNTVYYATSLAKRWSENRYILDLICILHNHFGFVFELLDILSRRNLTYKELAAIAKVSYGFSHENVDEIRKRILLFKTAKLVRNATIDSFTITARARRLLDAVHIDMPQITEMPAENRTVQTETGADFFAELRLAAKDSSNYEHLEKMVKEAFEKLGFEAQWLGGAGKTDVLLRAPGVGSNAFSVAVDAKSTNTGNVTDGNVDFDTLTEHRKKHNADFSAIVGGTFQNDRLINRAIEHGVVLVDINTLETLIRNQTEIPLKVASYKKLFQTAGLADISCLNEERNVFKRYGDLVREIMNCLIFEKNDPVTRGILQERDIYMALRGNTVFDPAPGIDEITNILEFLASPLIGCVEKNKDGYYAAGTLQDAARKFRFFAGACE